MDIKSFCSTEIIFTNKYELEQILLSLRSPNIVLVMSYSSVMRWGVDDFIGKLKKNCNELNGSFTWIKVVDTNPTQKSIMSSLQQIGSKKVDMIIAVGGGSAIDLAKGISAFYNSNRNNNCTIEEITVSIKNKSYIDREFIDIIAVPSTAGTGAELTQWATIWDENKSGKFSIDAPGLKPKKAIIVPELTLTVPKEMTLATGLDAMCQAIESYWSKHTNPIIQDVAYRAVELVVQNLKILIDDPDDIVSREKLCRASVLAGLAFSQTRTTACHSISYPLTRLYGIPHGLAVSLTLDAVSQINKGNYPNDKELLSLFNEYGGVKNWINMVSDNLVDMKLSTFGITENDIPIIVDNAFTSGRMDNNPVDLSKNDVREILESVM